MNIKARIPAAFVLFALLGGCSTTEPYNRQYVWRPTGANASNLATMAAAPGDLAHGRGVGPADGQIAAAAVDRLRYDHVKPLPDPNGGNSAVATGAGAAVLGSN